MDSTPALASPHSELIVRTGKQQGARRVLKAPITFIGSEKGCDIRLAIVGAVQPVHCVIARGPDGPVLRSWKGAVVLVQGEAVKTHELRDGDVVTIGPFEFEFRTSSLPASWPAKTPDYQDSSIDKRLEELRNLQRQLSDARAEFRSERKENERRIAEQTNELVAVRREAEKREEQARCEHSRLTRLRKRFIKRWKRHWSTERTRIEKETQRLQREQAALEARKAELLKRDEQARAHITVEQQRIEHSWQELDAAEQTARADEAKRQAEIVAQKGALAEEERRFKAERTALHREWLGMQQHTAQLRLEASGLEARIVNSRALLQHLRAGDQSRPLPASEIASEPPANELVEARLAELERLIAEVADQRRTLLEQTDRLAEARETWRGEEQRLVREMEQIGERLRSWEDRLINRERRAGNEESALEYEHTKLDQLRDRLDAWQARLQSQDVELREERLRLEADFQQRMRHFERREIAMADLCRRWTERRRAEVQQLRSEHRRCAKLRMAWQKRHSARDETDRATFDRQRELAEQALVLENARQNLLARAGDPRVAARKLERLQRRIERLNAREHEKLDQQRQALQAERAELNELFGRTDQRIENAAILEREIADRLADAESRERRLTDREVALAEMETVCRTQRESYQRECGELRDEIDRLAGLLIESAANEVTPLACAA